MQDASPEMLSLFCAALERESAEERAAYLDAACGTDAALRARLDALLRAHEQAGKGPGLPEKLLPTLDEPPTERPGTVIGPYKLLEQIGEGGFGVVFLAEQTAPVRRKVALKILKPGMDTRQIVARFEAERQALAIMDHPNIARVFDGGVVNSGQWLVDRKDKPGNELTTIGRPYFVMELVKGVPITDFCDQNHLTPRQRLELFIPVCLAVQHAHQKGIIHRDLKPSNVLVSRHDTTPVVKVIDFGVAKALGQELTDKTVFTGLAQMIGTPLYMSPEQAGMSDLDIDTRSDIYSLGVLLYELLTGTTPFSKERFKKAAYDEIRRIIREEEPPKPSTRISTLGQAATTASLNRQSDPRQLSQLFRGDLDWVVMKALEKDRNRRYETASSLALDLQHYLADEPVLACPPTAGYRLRKFVRRNRAALATASVVVAALLAGTALATWQAIVATQAKQEALTAAAAERKAVAALKEAKEAAEAREAETQAVLAFVENQIFAAARPRRQDGGLGRTVTLRQAMESALARVEGRFVDHPLIEARLRMTLGISFLYLGDTKTAEAQCARAQALYVRQFGPNHPDALSGSNNLALCYSALGQHTQALKLHEEALAVRRAKLGLSHKDTLASMTNVANGYYYLGRHAEALALREQTRERLEATVGPHHRRTLESMNNVAASYAALGRHEQARELYEQTIRLQEDKLGSDHPDVLTTMMNLAGTYDELGRHKEALALGEETLQRKRVRFGPDHPKTLESMVNLGNSYALLGQHTEALRLRQQTLELMRAKHGPDHPYTLGTMWNVAANLMDLDRGDEALPLIDDCLRRAVGKDVHPHLVPKVMDLRLQVFQRKTDAAGCRKTAEMWEHLHRKDADSLYHAARMRAVTAAVLRAVDKSPGATKQAEVEADRAMDWLHKAVAAGWKNTALLANDRDLNALRDREDFKKLKAETGKKKEQAAS